MRAAWCPAWGPPDVVGLEERPSPALADGQVRVAVSAAAVNFPDVLLVAGEYQVKVPPPFVPGSEFAGTVVEVADDVSTPVAGDRVFGTGLVGAFAEEVVVAAGAVTPIPDGVAEADAAAFGVAHRTAWHTLRSVAGVRPGDEVVVLGAGGGVGLAAVQLAAHLGATVTAVASSPEKLAAASAEGATHLVDHRAGDLRQALRDALPDGADVVVDPVGGDLAEPALRSLHYGGRFVTVGFASGTIPRVPLNLVLLKGSQIRAFEFLSFMVNQPEDAARNEAELLDLLAAGTARPHVGARFPLDRAADALALVGGGGAVGKVVIDVAAA
ncbi:MAG: NADPH:quinone oxidoreductase family protein [Acidimicrobiales bacterium]|nr:NADPH:quinone oxidoreductase family protein [Acidimicrobiales bacterium]MCB1017414.1 NADPH:quinone oxidoreductase family protein [Acidimicrobiales bacterium]